MTINAKPLLLWDNEVRAAWLAASASLTASASATGFPVANLADWRPWLAWTASGSSPLWTKIDLGATPPAVDSWAVFGHDLHTQAAGVKLQSSDDDATWADEVATVTPADNKSFFKSFASAEHRYWRQYIAAGYTAPPSIGCWFLGAKLQMPTWSSRPFSPYALTKKTTSPVSETGQHLESIVKYNWRPLRLSFNRLEITWFEANIRPFEENHVPELFALIWDATNHPNDCYLVRKTNNDFSAEMNPNSVNWSIEVGGVMETGA